MVLSAVGVKHEAPICFETEMVVWGAKARAEMMMTTTTTTKITLLPP
jgi:vacuolar-type H+-ATPase subunit B/Vma2